MLEKYALQGIWMWMVNIVKIAIDIVYILCIYLLGICMIPFLYGFLRIAKNPF